MQQDDRRSIGSTGALVDRGGAATRKRHRSRRGKTRRLGARNADGVERLRGCGRPHGMSSHGLDCRKRLLDAERAIVWSLGAARPSAFGEPAGPRLVVRVSELPSIDQRARRTCPQRRCRQPGPRNDARASTTVDRALRGENIVVAPWSSTAPLDLSARANRAHDTARITHTSAKHPMPAVANTRGRNMVDSLSARRRRRPDATVADRSRRSIRTIRQFVLLHRRLPSSRDPSAVDRPARDEQTSSCLMCGSQCVEGHPREGRQVGPLCDPAHGARRSVAASRESCRSTRPPRHRRPPATAHAPANGRRGPRPARAPSLRRRTPSRSPRARLRSAFFPLRELAVAAALQSSTRTLASLIPRSTYRAQASSAGEGTSSSSAG